jgi:hypothetical protein
MIRLLALLLFSLPAFGQAWSGILATDRAMDWTAAGIPGGVPTRSTVCSNVSSGASTATIQSAIDGCASGQVVQLAAGSYSLTASLHMNRSNVTLRGAGPTQTTITLNGFTILMGNGSGGQGSTPGGLTAVALTTYTQGSTVLSVASTTGLAAGQVVAIVQANPAYATGTGNEGDESASWILNPANFFGGSGATVAELVRIASVGVGTVTIESPGLSMTYTSGLTPKLMRWTDAQQYYNNSVENLKAVGSSDFAVSMVFCHMCWIKNVALIGTSSTRAGFYSFFSYRGEMRDSYLSASNTAGAPTEYGIEIDRSSLLKVENNIIFGFTSAVLIETSSGVVLGYNYITRTPTDNVYPNIASHRGHVWKVLVEGNVTHKLQWDNVWGSGSHNTAFRNRFSGTEPNAGNYRIPIVISAQNKYMNVIANVLGDTTFHTVYQCIDSTVSDNDNVIYDLGWWGDCVGHGATSYDTVVVSSLVRWGNWDVVTYAANGSTNGIRYCTGSGAGNAACTASETANSDPTFPGLSSPATSFPSSFYNGVTTAHASCGTGLSFWKVPGGSCPKYPPIGPDVTCTTNCISNTASHAAQIPAQLCYANTAKDGSGFLTAFDADACYEADTDTTIRPEPPTNVTVTQNLLH